MNCQDCKYLVLPSPEEIKSKFRLKGLPYCRQAPSRHYDRLCDPTLECEWGEPKEEDTVGTPSTTPKTKNGGTKTMTFPSKETVKAVRDRYPQGTRVELISMSDPYNTALTAGSCGSVSHIDDTATVFVDWDCGSRLGCVYGEDSFRLLLTEDIEKGEQPK